MRSKDFSYREVIHLIAYTDGSYRKVNGEYKCGWAYILMNEQGEIVHQEYGSTNEYISTRNVVGELVAVVNLVGFCELMGVEELTIYHDYLLTLTNSTPPPWKVLRDRPLPKYS